MPRTHNVTLHFGATSDSATVHLEGGDQVIDLSQFRSGVLVTAQEKGESPDEFRARAKSASQAARKKAISNRNAALELVRDFVLEKRQMPQF